MDLVGGYLHVKVAEKDRPKTAFAAPFGLFQFKQMPFGLTNAPATFSRVMAEALRGLTPDMALVYLDDVIVHNSDFETHVERLKAVLEHFRRAGLKIKPQKCHLLRTSVPYLGHIVSSDGISPDPELVRVIKDWPTPANVAEVRTFLGKTGYYRQFIRNYATVAEPLLRLTRKSSGKFIWDRSCQLAFAHLKDRLTSCPILVYPDFSSDFILDTDASDYGIGGVLSQVKNGQEQVIAYGSRALSKAERNYSTTKKEMLALVDFTKKFKPYLWGRKFVARVDHASLTWLRNFRDPPGQLARWLEQLAEFDLQPVYRKGSAHQNADALSRIPWQCSQTNDKPPHCNSCPEATESESNSKEVGPSATFTFKNRCYTLAEPMMFRRWSPVELRSAQLKDSTLQLGIQWCEEGKRPPKEEMQG